MGSSLKFCVVAEGGADLPQHDADAAGVAAGPGIEVAAAAARVVGGIEMGGGQMGDEVLTASGVFSRQRHSDPALAVVFDFIVFAGDGVSRAS